MSNNELILIPNGMYVLILPKFLEQILLYLGIENLNRLTHMVLRNNQLG